MLAALVLVAAAPDARASTAALSQQLAEVAPSWAFERFLERLMAAESRGRTHARNPRSSALGPFQFIKSTFLDVVNRHFASEVVGLSEEQLLDRRTDPDLSRRAAAVFCVEIAEYLKDRGIEPTFAHLRLAYLLGPGDAIRVLQAEPSTRLGDLLSRAASQPVHDRHERRRTRRPQRARCRRYTRRTRHRRADSQVGSDGAAR